MRGVGNPVWQTTAAATSMQCLVVLTWMLHQTYLCCSVSSGTMFFKIFNLRVFMKE